MAIQFHELPVDAFPESVRPAIARFNRELRDLFALEGTIRRPLRTQRSDATVVRSSEIQVDASRVTGLSLATLGGAPIDASFITVANNSTLTGERALSISSPLASSDGGANGSFTISLPTLPIANGGTGQTSSTAAFNALDPMTTKGDLIVNDGTNSIRLSVGTNAQALLSDSTQASGVSWTTISGTPGITVSSINSAGVALTFIRTDATIAIVDGTTPQTVALVAAGGSANKASRSDHKHRGVAGLAVNTGGGILEANFDDATPAVPALSTNGLWQSDGSGNISVSIPIVLGVSATGVTNAGYTANVTLNLVYAESTFTGNTGSTAYTISDLVKNLKNARVLKA